MFADYWLGSWGTFHSTHHHVGKSLGLNKIDRLKIIAFFPSLLSSGFITGKSLCLLNQILPTAREVVLFYHDQDVKSKDPFFFASREPVKSAPFNSGNHSGGAVQQSRVRGNAQRWGHCWERMDCFLGIKSLMDTEKLPLMLQLGERIGNSPGWEAHKDTCRKCRRQPCICGNVTFMEVDNNWWQYHLILMCVPVLIVRLCPGDKLIL